MWIYLHISQSDPSHVEDHGDLFDEDEAAVQDQVEVHDQLVEEVELLLLGLYADVRLLDSVLHKLFHLLFI